MENIDYRNDYLYDPDFNEDEGTLYLFNLVKQNNLEELHRDLEDYPNAVNIRDYLNDDTALHIATKSGEGDIDIVKELIRFGADVNAKNKNGHTPLKYAVEQNQKEIVVYLLDAGANTEIKDDSGRTPLFIASSQLDIPLIDILVSRGANVNKKDKQGYTPLHVAASNYHSRDSKKRIETLKTLINAGAKVGTKNKYGQTFLDALDDT